MDDVVLRHVAERLAQRVEVGIEIDAVEQHRAAVCRPEAAHGIDKGRLAGTAHSDHGNKLTWHHGERDVAQDQLPSAHVATKRDDVEAGVPLFAEELEQPAAASLREDEEEVADADAVARAKLCAP